MLGLVDLPSRLESWLAGQAPAATLIVVGGGPLVEALRQQQRLWGYPDEVAHQLAIKLMDVNAFQLAQVLSNSRLQRGWHPAGCDWQQGEVAILECGDWAAAETGFEPSWRTTSDSIAAEIAGRVGASELVVFKSALRERAREPGAYLDPRFELHLPPGVVLRVVDLASEGFPESVEQGAE